jgi:signal transduction histidine kinase
MRLRPRTLRGRLTLLFALITVVLSTLVGVLVDVEYRSALTSALDAGLRARFEAVAQQQSSESNGTNIQPVLPDAESFAQVLDSSGDVVAAAPRALLIRPVLTTTEIREARQHRLTVVRDAGPRGERARFMAGPAPGRGQVVIVGTSLEETTHAQHRLELALGIGLPLLAALVTLLVWFLAGAALSPVQEMIEDADAISARSARQLTRRLPVPENSGEELAELARRLNALLERIESALEHERVFLDDASHELRTPIAIARGELELARSQVERDPETAAALDSALEEIDRLDHLAVSLLVLARTRAAGPPPETPVQLDEVARRAVEQATSGSNRTEIHPTVVGHATSRGDAATIERAVRNLVENALRYARHEVTVTVGRDNGSAVVEVHDDGPGFAREWLEHGVGRFATGDRSDDHGGAGLGLAIVDAIAASHGGAVELANGAPTGHAAPVSPGDGDGLGAAPDGGAGSAAGRDGDGAPAGSAEEAPVPVGGAVVRLRLPAR